MDHPPVRRKVSPGKRLSVRIGASPVAVILAAVTVAAVGCTAQQQTAKPDGPSPAPSAATVAVPDPRTGPRADVYRVLDAHAAALLAGDEAGWLAAIDPANTKLTSRYRQLYATLRKLGVTAWSYHSVLEPKPLDGGRVVVDAYIVYCFHDTRCLPWDPSADAENTPPTLRRSLVMSRDDGRWLLTDDDTYGSINRNDPPWFRTR